MKREGYAGKKITLVAADNGGWIVYGPSSVLSEGFVESTRAYGSAADMIAGLSLLLSSPSESFLSVRGEAMTQGDMDAGFAAIKS